jgi:predicted DNA binding CopG/RHH family protein
MKKQKKDTKFKDIPKFNSEDEEREFWGSHDSTEYIDWSNAQEMIFPNLKPSTQSISIRLPLSMLDDLKVIANEMDVPYQSFIKMILKEKIEERYGKKKLKSHL